MRVNCIYSGGEESSPLFDFIGQTHPCHCTTRTTQRVICCLSQFYLYITLKRKERLFFMILEVLITQKGFKCEVVRTKDNNTPHIIYLAQECGHDD